MAALMVGHTGSVRGLKGGVQKLLAELREKSERLEESPVLQRLREVCVCSLHYDLACSLSLHCMYSMQEESPSLPGGRGKVVVYVTSMQAVRKTYEQCQSILQILRAHQVAFVAKDIYLHPDYNEELQLRLGETKLSVPHVCTVATCNIGTVCLDVQNIGWFVFIISHCAVVH